MTTILYSNQQKSMHKRHNICKETVMSIPVVILTQKNFYLLDAFNQKLDILKASGLIDFWYQEDVKKKLKLDVAKSPQVLSLTELFACFQILLFGMISSFLVFLAELTISMSQKVCARSK